MDDERAAPATAVLVNGKRREVRTERDTALLYVLRNHLGLKGTRFGCGLGLCGACLVLVDGLAAEELDVSPARVRMMPAVTGVSPDEGYTSGSLSVQYSGAALRLICAEVRGRFLAAARLGVPEDKLTVADGQIQAPNGRASSYWELAGAGLLDQPATGDYQPKPASAYRVVGTSLPRLDLPDKLTGRPRYTHDLSPDGLCYGRVVRPPSRGATLARLDPAAALALGYGSAPCRSPRTTSSPPCRTDVRRSGLRTASAVRRGPAPAAARPRAPGPAHRRGTGGPVRARGRCRAYG